MSDGSIKKGTSRFRGRSEHTLDGKGRLNVPARFRDVLLRNYDDRLLITPPWQKCLRVYPLPEWEKKEMSLLSMDHQQPHVARMIRYLVGGSYECQIDKSGRILLPAELRNSLNLQKEVVMNGMLTFFEVWDKETWEQESRVTDDDFQAFENTFNELGLY